MRDSAIPTSPVACSSQAAPSSLTSAACCKRPGKPPGNSCPQSVALRTDPHNRASRSTAHPSISIHLAPEDPWSASDITVFTTDERSSRPPAELSHRITAMLKSVNLTERIRSSAIKSRVWNHAIDKQPALIVQAASTEDVVPGGLARGEGRPIAVRGDAHSVAGFRSVTTESSSTSRK